MEYSRLSKRSIGRSATVAAIVATLGAGLLVFFLIRANPFPGVSIPDKFEFDPASSSLAVCVAVFPGRCEVEEAAPFVNHLRFRCTDGTVLAIDGNPATVFVIADEQLYLASPSCGGPGGTVSRHSLANGREIWSRYLGAIECLEHFSYANYLNLSLTEGTVGVRGTESFGDYLDVYDRMTGWRMARHVYRKGFVVPKGPINPFHP